MKTIYDMIETLTPEERILHADLIEECIERESSLESESKKMEHNIKLLHEITINFLRNIENLYKSSAAIKKAYEKVNGRIMEYYLSNIPDDRFYHV